MIGQGNVSLIDTSTPLYSDSQSVASYKVQFVTLHKSEVSLLNKIEEASSTTVNPKSVELSKSKTVIFRGLLDQYAGQWMD